MIKYNTSDLIKRASQLADLENSDFISWNENIMAINEAYQAVYQKAINRDEKFYLKECVINNPVYQADKTCYELPEDFYQLYAVNDLASNACIIRNSVNNPVGNKGYNIINNELVIYGANASPISLKYYPVPKTLAYKAKDVPIKLPVSMADVEIDDIYDRHICYHNGNEIHTYNWETGEDVLVINLEERNTITSVIACKNGISVRYTGVESEYYTRLFIYDKTYEYMSIQVPSLGAINGLDEDKNVVNYIKSGKDKGFLNTFYADISPIHLGTTLATLFNEIIALSTAENEIRTSFIGKNIIKLHRLQIITASSGNIFKIYSYTCDIEKDEIIEQSIREVPEAEASYDSEIVSIFNNVYNFYNSGSKYSLDNNIANYTIKDLTITTEDSVIKYGNVIGVMKLDSNTGYGFMCKQGNNAVIKSLFQDTEIDYPNNLFINFLAYKLAMMYKAKQGGDLNGIMIQLQQAEDQFYDSIARDIYSNVRIQNVY